MSVSASKGASKNGSLKGWIKKLGMAGFLFFLIKGLLWLLVPLLFVLFGVH